MALAPKNKKRTLKHRFSVQYYSYMPQRRRYRALLWAAVLVVAAVIAVQLAWPQGRGLPLAGVPGQSLMLANHEVMAKEITEDFSAATLRLTTSPSKTVEYPLKTTGAEPNTEDMIEKMSDYPLWQRLIPGTILRPSASLNELDVFYTQARLEKFSQLASKKLSFAPQNARLAIEKGRLVATDARAGSKVTEADVLQPTSTTTMSFGTTTVEIAAKRLPAARTAKDLAKVRAQAEATLAHTVTIKAGDQQFSPNKAEIASWVVLNTNASGNVTLSIDKNKIKAYLGELNKKVGIPAGQTNIMLVDGRETGRTTGTVGRKINEEEVASQLAAALLVPPQEVAITAPFTQVQPSVIFNSKYTATQAGLQAYVEDVAETRNMHIVIQQLDGDKWYAHARDTESIPSASTYKLFVALMLFEKINKGEMRWSDPMLDTTAGVCFDRMTVASTNPCAQKWIAEYGRPQLNDFVYAHGFSRGTTFTSNIATHTTAADLNKFMIGLNDGTLVSGANRDLLLHNLGRHPYRYGIPTGSSGQVYDKVGFLWDYVHDTAIVHHPRGTYVMTIMTKGQSYGAIAGVTREVERIMYP